MTNRTPLYLDSGVIQMMAAGDTVPLANGGTGATSASGARAALGVTATGADGNYLSSSTSSTQGGYFASVRLFNATGGFYVQIINSDTSISATRTLNLNLNNAGRTVSLSGSLTVPSAATVSGTNTGDEPAASTTISGVVELATSAETITGTDTVRAVTPAGAAAAYLPLNGGTATGLVTLGAGGDNTPAATPSTTAVGYLGVPQASKAANYTLTMAEAGKGIYFTATGKTLTIPANSSVAFPIGTVLVAYISTGSLTVAITTDTLRWIPSNTTGSRTVTAPGKLILEKVTATEWWCSGVNVS